MVRSIFPLLCRTFKSFYYFQNIIVGKILILNFFLLPQLIFYLVKSAPKSHFSRCLRSYCKSLTAQRKKAFMVHELWVFIDKKTNKLVLFQVFAFDYKLFLYCCSKLNGSFGPPMQICVQYPGFFHFSLQI